MLIIFFDIFLLFVLIYLMRPTERPKKSKAIRLSFLFFLQNFLKDSSAFLYRFYILKTALSLFDFQKIKSCTYRFTLSLIFNKHSLVTFYMSFQIADVIRCSVCEAVSRTGFRFLLFKIFTIQFWDQGHKQNANEIPVRSRFDFR